MGHVYIFIHVSRPSNFTQFIFLRKILQIAIIKHPSDGFNKGIPINSVHPVPDHSEKRTLGTFKLKCNSYNS